MDIQSLATAAQGKELVKEAGRRVMIPRIGNGQSHPFFMEPQIDRSGHFMGEVYLKGQKVGELVIVFLPDQKIDLCQHSPSEKETQGDSDVLIIRGPALESSSSDSIISLTEAGSSVRIVNPEDRYDTERFAGGGMGAFWRVIVDFSNMSRGVELITQSHQKQSYQEDPSLS